MGACWPPAVRTRRSGCGRSSRDERARTRAVSGLRVVDRPGVGCYLAHQASAIALQLKPPTVARPATSMLVGLMPVLGLMNSTCAGTSAQPAPPVASMPLGQVAVTCLKAVVSLTDETLTTRRSSTL